MVKLFIDDTRDPQRPLKGVDQDWVIVRTYDEAIQYFSNNPCPEFCSFDNDLGIGKEGADIAKWLIDYDLDHDGHYIPYDFQYYVHSQNPVRREYINKTLENYLKFKRKCKI